MMPACRSVHNQIFLGRVHMEAEVLRLPLLTLLVHCVCLFQVQVIGVPGVELEVPGRKVLIAEECCREES